MRIGSARRIGIFHSRKAAPAWETGFVGRSAEFRNQLQLIDLGRSFEQRSTRDHFGQDAAYAPHVDGWTVLFLARQQLRRTIPACHHHIGVSMRPHSPSFARPRLTWIAVGSSQTEIGNLQLTLVVDQKVGGLHITVQDAILVEVECAFEQLLHVELDLAVFESNRGILQHTVEIVVHVRFDHVHVAQFAPFARGTKGHVDDRNDAWMLELFQQLDLAKSGDR